MLDAVEIPVAVKLEPLLQLDRLDGVAARRDGASGLVLFNRFLQPEIDPESLSISSRIDLSTPADQRLPMTWIAILRGRIDASLAASGGVETRLTSPDSCSRARTSS